MCVYAIHAVELYTTTTVRPDNALSVDVRFPVWANRYRNLSRPEKLCASTAKQKGLTHKQGTLDSVTYSSSQGWMNPRSVRAYLLYLTAMSTRTTGTVCFRGVCLPFQQRKSYLVESSSFAKSTLHNLWFTHSLEYDIILIALISKRCQI